MYIIAIYDVEAKRTNLFKKLCRSYFTHIQKSVFEGEISEKKFEEFIVKVKKLIKNDAFFKVFIIKNSKNIDFLTFGEIPDENILV